MALIVWADPPRAARQARSLEGEATALAAALGGGPVLTVAIGERAVWAWTSGCHLTDDPVEAVRFVENELGELLADSDAAARLRATVRMYLEENLSPARAARRLGVHQNTVVYRVKQTAELLGHAVEQRRLQIEVALRLSGMIDGLRIAAQRGRQTLG